MLAKFLAVEEATSIAPHSTAEVKIQDSDLSNVGFMFPTTEFAARGLVLANAGLLLGPAKAFVYNSKDVTQNIAKGECIAINVKLEEEGLMMGELQAPSASEENDSESEATESETNESSAEASTESAETDAPVNPDETTDPMEGNDSENDSSEAESETDASLENAAASEAAATETNASSEKKSTRSRK